jgi:hypothetical protein
MNLFFEFKSFYYNAGFYISFGTLLICIILLCIFWIKGIKFIRNILYKNLPTKSMKEISKNKNENLNNNINKDNNDDKNNKDFDKKLKIRTNKFVKTVKNNPKMNLFVIKNNKNSNPPPKGNNLKKVEQYTKEMKMENSLDKKTEKDDNFLDYNNKNSIDIFKENKINDKRNKKFRSRNNERISFIKEGGTHETISSKDNLIKFNNINLYFAYGKNYEKNQKDNSLKNRNEGQIEIYNIKKIKEEIHA